MKSHALLRFRMIVAMVLGIVFVIAALNSYHMQSLALPWKSVPWVLKALFGLLWIAQSYFMWRQFESA
jgi:hypothetical protein